MPDDPTTEDNRRAWRALGSFTRPFLTAFTDGDPITAGADRPMRERIPGAVGQPHRTIEGAGHFVQEDAPGQFAEAIGEVLDAV
jgi:haloalkane dehalogenase